MLPDWRRYQYGSGWVRPLRNRVSELRKLRGWSQKALGDQLGVSRQAVNAIERGKHDPSLLLAFRIAKLFEVSIEDVFDAEIT